MTKNISGKGKHHDYQVFRYVYFLHILTTSYSGFVRKNFSDDIVIIDKYIIDIICDLIVDTENPGLVFLRRLYTQRFWTKGLHAIFLAEKILWMIKPQEE